MLQLQVSDKYGVLDITAFGDTAAEILKISLDVMNDIAKNNTPYTHLSSLYSPSSTLTLSVLLMQPDTGEDEVHEKLMHIRGTTLHQSTNTVSFFWRGATGLRSRPFSG